MGEKYILYGIGEDYRILFWWPYSDTLAALYGLSYLTVKELLDYAEYLSVYIKI